MRYLIAIALVAGCGDNKKAVTQDAPPSSNLKACLDRPDVLSTAPTGQLPCDLVPPGLELP